MDKPAVVQRVLTVMHKALSNLKAKRPNRPAFLIILYTSRLRDGIWRGTVGSNH